MSIKGCLRIFLFKCIFSSVFTLFPLAGMQQNGTLPTPFPESSEAKVCKEVVKWAQITARFKEAHEAHGEFYPPAFEKFKEATKELVKVLQDHSLHKTVEGLTYTVPTNYNTRKDFKMCCNFIFECIHPLENSDDIAQKMDVIINNYKLPPALEKAHRLYSYLSLRQSSAEFKEFPNFFSDLNCLESVIKDWHNQCPPQVEDCENTEAVNELVKNCDIYKTTFESNFNQRVNVWQRTLGAEHKPNDTAYLSAEESYINYACGQECDIDKYKPGLLKARWTYNVLTLHKNEYLQYDLLSEALINHLNAFGTQEKTDRANGFLRPFMLALAIDPKPILLDDIAVLTQTYCHKPYDEMFEKSAIAAFLEHNELYNTWSAVMKKYFKNLSKKVLTHEQASKCLVPLYHFTQAMMTLAPQASPGHITIVEKFAQKNITNHLITGMQIQEDIQNLNNELILYTQHQQWWRTCRMLVGCSSLFLVAMYCVYSQHYVPAR